MDYLETFINLLFFYLTHPDTYKVVTLSAIYWKLMKVREVNKVPYYIWPRFRKRRYTFDPFIRLSETGAALVQRSL